MKTILLLLLFLAGCMRDSEYAECVKATGATLKTEREWCRTITTDFERNIIEQDTTVSGLITVVFVERYEDMKLETLACDFLTPYEYKLLRDHSHAF